MPKAVSPNGVLPVDKPVGPTSHDVVSKVRRAIGTRQIGHTGTLDPFASGLLLLCVGPATRLAEYLVGLPKTYVAEARLGVATDTDDLQGAVVSVREDWSSLPADRIARAFTDQVGEREQVPPAYSAKKVAGERAYARARRGEALDLEPVRIKIHRIEVLELALPLVRFEVECSSGTYIRAIARDAGEVLGVGAHLTALRRTRVGEHDVENAVPLDGLDQADRVAGAMIRPLLALSHLRQVEIGSEAAEDFAHGRVVSSPPGSPDTNTIIISIAGDLVGIGEADGSLIRPRKVMARG